MDEILRSLHRPVWSSTTAIPEKLTTDGAWVIGRHPGRDGSASQPKARDPLDSGVHPEAITHTMEPGRAASPERSSVVFHSSPARPAPNAEDAP